MSKENEFRQLIARAESETLDFKSEGYDLKNNRDGFIKDILAMANTPRERPAHILLGVQWTPEEGSTVLGLGRQFDDVDFQNAFGHGRVQPNPRFTYTPLEFEGMQVGVLEIPLANDGPYTPVKDFEGLQAGVIYYRRGTQNDRAVGSELNRISDYFRNGDVGLPAVTVDDAWHRFFEAVHRFEPATTYLLAVDRLSRTESASVQALGLAPWRAVVDFDPESDVSGFLSNIADSLGQHRVIHRVVRGDYRVQPEPGTHWFFARGLSGRQETISDGNHRAWLKAYKQELGQQLARLARAVSPTPIVALILWSDVELRNHLRTLIEELYGAFGETVEVVVVSSDAPSFETIAEDAGATFVRMTLRSLCGGVAVHYADLQRVDEERFVLPNRDGGPVEVQAADRLWLSEDLDLVHRTAGLSGDDNAGDYRQGAEVS